MDRENKYGVEGEETQVVPDEPGVLDAGEGLVGVVGEGLATGLSRVAG